jgi:predicted dithiol-disulfide oxidoreductase (DUF899 family)
MTANITEKPKIVSRDEWLAARKQLLAREKELTRQRDEVNRLRRGLPWVKVEKRYEFEGPKGRESLADLFEGRSQLIVYHFMFGPDWKEGCPSCSFMSDHVDGALAHLAARDVTYVAVSRAPLAQIEAFRRRMGWRFKWVSSLESDFNFDFHVSATPEDHARGRIDYNYSEMDFSGDELPGMSAFSRDSSGAVFHTYSCYARGLDLLIGAYNWLDLAPRGRDEDALPWTMAWVRHHDKYEQAPAQKEHCHG